MIGGMDCEEKENLSSRYRLRCLFTESSRKEVDKMQNCYRYVSCRYLKHIITSMYNT